MTHHVKTCSGSLVGHRLVGHRHVGVGLLPLVIALYCQVEPPGKVGRFRIGPGQLWVAIFAVALALPFAIADFRAVHTATIRDRVPYTRKASDVARFQEDRLRQNRPDPIDRLQQRIQRSTLYTGPDACFHHLDLLGQKV